MLLRLHKKQKKGRLEVDPAKRLRDPKLFLEAFATDQWSYGNTLPTESQRYSGNGVLRESQLFAKKNDNQTDNQTTKLWLSILAKMTTSCHPLVASLAID